MNETVKSASIVNSVAANQNSNIIWQHKPTKEYDKNINHESATILMKCFTIVQFCPWFKKSK